MRIANAFGRTSAPLGATQRAAAAPATTVGTALVPVAPMQATGVVARPARRALTDFLAHLIATDRQAPQTRTRRRVEPDEAARAYRQTLAQPVTGPVLSRSL
jgi:hypothetical protein